MATNTIQITDISEELGRLWNKERGEKKTRASLFNFILYVQSNSQAELYQKLIKTVVSKFPCRVILILCAESDQEGYLKTSVSSETIGEGELQIYCEIIQIEVAGKLVERVPYLVLPQILPDLPVYLLWTQDPSAENTVLPHLEPFADRIIFDSESTYDLQRYSISVLSLMERFHCDIGDLHWSSCSGWRQLLMQLFNTPDTLASLVQAKIIRIFYNRRSKNLAQKGKHPDIEAAYLQAWIASRLNWQFQSFENHEGNIRLLYQRPMSQIVVLLIPQEVEMLPSGSLLEIVIESEKNEGHYSLKRDPQSRQVFVQYSEKNLCQLPYCIALSGSQEGQEIVEEIFYPSGGQHYHEMLETLTNIAWKSENL